MAGAELVERSFLTQEVRGLNPENIEHLFAVNSIEQTKVKKKMPGMTHF